MWETSVLVMLATMFKEQSIFILPFLWSSFLWRNHFSQIKRHFIIVITSGFPFLIYYIFKRGTSQIHVIYEEAKEYKAIKIPSVRDPYKFVEQIKSQRDFLGSESDKLNGILSKGDPTEE